MCFLPQLEMIHIYMCLTLDHIKSLLFYNSNKEVVRV